MIQNRLKAKRAKKFAVLLLLVLLGACSRQDTADDNVVGTTSPANDLQTRRFRLPETTGRRLILEQGNVWGVGIPGFGVNAIPVLTGEYSTPGDRHFQVWLTREVLYFDTNWTPWPDLVETRSRAAAGGTLAGRPLNGVWSVVFLFSDDFTPEEQAEIMRATAPRFTQFVSTSNHVSDSSLPAIIEY
jgi:hypothetical protein